MAILNENDINKRLIDNTALFNNIYVINQKFDIIPDSKEHYGASINFQDIKEVRSEFLNELYYTIVDWVYSSEKYDELKKLYMSAGRSEGAANADILQKAHNKFRGNKNSENLLIQGQLGELLLFHFIQRCMRAVPLLRKMKIATSRDHERFGADAIHFKIDNEKPIVILGEAKTYTSDYKFNAAFEDAINSILTTYANHKEELNLYLHEDFLDKEMNELAEKYLNNTLENVEVHLVSIVVYNETKALNGTTESEMKQQIKKIIEERYANFDKNKIDLKTNAILSRITYIVFPVWELDELAQQFQDKL